MKLFIPFILSFILVKYVRSISLANNIFIDHPKDRGQHNKPKPRSGGISIFLSVLFFFIFDFLFEKNMSINLLVIFISFSFSYFFIGLLDDFTNLNFKLKFFLQIISSISTIILIQILFNEEIKNLYFYFLFIFIFSISFININNFMDGTDSIVITNFIFFLINSILYLYIFDLVDLTSFLIWLLVTSLVFLFYNFPPSKIFLGDAGSYFIGSIVVIVVCYLTILDYKYFLIFLNIYSFFLVDTSLTLLRRLSNKENIFKPHNQHIYQILSLNNNTRFSIKYILYMFILSTIIWIPIFHENIVILTIINYILLSYFYLFVRKNEISK